MVSLADSLVASSSRPLSLTMRTDLSARRQRYQGRMYWVVKEPIGLRYFRFQEEEFAVLNMMKDGASLEDIKKQFEEEFAPHKITYQDLQQFIGTLHRSGLVISDAPGQGKQLRKRRDERKRKEMLARMSNVLAIRFKGIDPERLLNRMYPWTRWFFAKTTAIFFACVAISALLLIGVQFETFHNRLPGFQSFFGPKNWLLLGATLAVTKVMHEFGHGLLCKKFGGECHEMGVMFLVLTPCLYCNVSDSWMLPNKWHRAAIGAGGIYVELVLASTATFVWWFTEPGTLNHLALRVMFICSISTILFNGNPLLRFDGYYILSDIVEIPNLRQKASKILQQFASKLCLGLEVPEDPFLPQRNQGFFALYTIAAVIYRWFIFFSILFFLNKVFEPYGLKIIGQIIALMGLFGLVVQPLWKAGKFFHVPGRMDQVKWPRVYITLAVAAAVILMVLGLPLPRRVKCSLQIQPRDSKPVNVHVPGKLADVMVRPGQTVEFDQPLMQLENPQLDVEIKALEAQVEEYEIEVQKLQNLSLAHRDRQAEGQEPEARTRLAAKKKELQEKLEEYERLTLKAPIAGTVLPPMVMPVRPTPQDQLPSWNGSLFDPKNRGVYLDVSEIPVVQIGDPSQIEAILMIDQTDIDFVHVSQNVRIKLDGLAWRKYESTIEDISDRPMQVASQSAATAAGGELATRPDASGNQRPLSATYQARAAIDDPDDLIGIGYRGRAKIEAGTQTLGNRIWRYLARTFHFDL